MDPDKNVRCILYNWNSNMYTPDDVTSSLSRLEFLIIDELIPREGQYNNLLDVRFASMTPLLWEMLKLKSGIIDEFHCSIRLAVGEDDDISMDGCNLHTRTELISQCVKSLRILNA